MQNTAIPTVQRLFTLYQPEHYELSLELDRPNRTFAGTTIVSGSLSEKSDAILLHGKALEITSATIDELPAETTVEGDTITLRSRSMLEAGDHTVSVTFSGRITDAMHGLYPCYYDHDGQKKELLATQFESHHAREVFPCIDEPEAKATFDVTLKTETDVSVLSNMPIREQINGIDHLVTQFDRTPRMSPYLLAFVVGELQSKTAETKDGVTVTTWATPAQPADSLDFALDVAVRSIDFFNDYFGIPYPLPKADHVALPDFSSGAMENWGLITYREICMLADRTTSISGRQFTATVIAHETSHQWFGNLVTMKWWDDLWLNESFATLMEYVCVDKLFPAWNIWMTFATSETLSALRRDYLPGVQSVKTPVNHPDEISTLFDPSIVYAKGARLLAMLHDYVGEEAFRNGLTQYFKDHAYKNTVGNDLWQALSSTSHHDIKSFMTPWLEQSGLPVVHLKKEGDQQLTLRQERFVVGATAEDNALWPIPLKATDGSGVPEIFDTKETVVPYFPQLQINRGGRGHFLSHYADPDLLQARIDAIKKGEQPNPADRLTLLHDTGLLSRAGFTPAHALVDMIEVYGQETSEPVWDIIALTINDLKRFVETDEEAERILKARIIRLAQPSYDRLGWEVKENESESDTKLRATIIGLLTYAEDPSVIERGLKDFHGHENLLDLPGEMRGIIFVIVAKHGTAEDIERLITTHKTTASSDLQGDIAVGLTATRDEALIARLLSFLKDEQTIRLQDVDRWFAYLIRSRYAREATWMWMQENWEWVVATFAGDKSYDNFVRYSANALPNREWLERFREFFWSMRDIPALKRAIELGASDITARAEWLERDQAALLAHIKSGR